MEHHPPLTRIQTLNEFKLQTMRARLLHSQSTDLIGGLCPSGQTRRGEIRTRCFAVRGFGFAALLASVALACAGQADKPESPLPEAPKPQVTAQATPQASRPCQAAKPVEQPPSPGSTPADAGTQSPPAPAPLCTPIPVINWFARFLNGPEVKPLTPAEKARLAARNVVDPFNAITILGTAAISVGSDAHSPYGPGMSGFGKYVGVAYTQDMTGEFFDTFLIPSVVHQDPHYHRMPDATIPRRIRHALAQVVWTQGDDGKGMVNYGNVVGFVIDDEIANLYVPGRETDAQASAARYGIGLATAPIDNFVTEFLPDVARRIHIRVVLIQRIINQVAKQGGPGAS